MTNQPDKMPREIWAFKDDAVTSGWYDFSPREPTTKYLRADIVAGLVEAVRGLCFGVDWNNGTHAKIYRPKIIEALKQFESEE